MKQTDFANTINSVYRPFLEEIGFMMEPLELSGRIYLATFTNGKLTLIVSFEPGENHSTVLVHPNPLPHFSAIDDTDVSPRLSDLNNRFMKLISSDDRAENNAFFSVHSIQYTEEQHLVKSAKELRLVLPKYLLTL